MPQGQHVRKVGTAEPTLAEELAGFGEDDLVEMTNLQEDDTGIPGVIFISTTRGSHGPCVKYFVKAGRSQPSFSSRYRTRQGFWPTACRCAISAAPPPRSSNGFG